MEDTARIRRFPVCCCLPMLRPVRAEVSGEKPNIAEGIFNGGGTVPVGLIGWGLDRGGARAKSLRVEPIGVRNVDMQVAGRRLKFSVGFVDFDRGDPNLDRGVKQFALGRLGDTEDLRT